MQYIMLLLLSSLLTITLALKNLEEPEEVQILAGINYHFSIDYCTISIPPYITTMNAHCYCFYNPITKTSYKCSIPGPTFIFYPGTKVTMTWYNRMKGDAISDDAFFNKYKDLDISNLHTHGLHISPNEDDVFVKIIPGQSHTYKYSIPKDHYPGTHWMHAHHHGSVSFQITSGLFSALLVKYSDDNLLGDDNLINMNENILIFHSYYIITTSLCDCNNTLQWQQYFYYPPQFDVEDCITGKLCFQVFSHCYEYCSFPATQRAVSSFTYNIQSDHDDNYQLFLVNGQFRPNIDLTVGTYRRLRFINAMTQYYIQYKFPIRECEWYIIAIDGIFLNYNEVRNIDFTPYYGYYLLPPGGRLDLTVKCNEIGVHNIITSENNDIDIDLVNIVRVPALNILFHITVRDTNINNDIVKDKPLSYPDRPDYLKDLTNENTNNCECNTYFENNNNTKPITWNTTDCGIVFNMQDNHNINGLVFDPNRPTTSLEYGKVYSFTFIPHMHPYHQHVIPFQMMTNIGTNGFQAQAGDWYDTIGGPRFKEYIFRTYPIDYTGHQVIHCHNIPHEDKGMMTFANILQPHQTCDNGTIIGNPTKEPTETPTPRPTKYPTDSPTPSPTPNPTPFPTPAPTTTPTPKPTDSPTLEPTIPTSEPTFDPTISPTPPTRKPSKYPTPPTMSPITRKPTRSPIRNICPIEPDIEFDFIVLYDNSCGLSDDTCDELLEFVGEVISSILDTTNRTRVQTMATTADDAPQVVVTFDNLNLQNNPLKYVQTVRQVGECTYGGNGMTNLDTAIIDGIFDFDLNDNRIDKFIIINACIDNSDDICDLVAETLYEQEIDAYVVNFIELSDASNVITEPDANNYLLCIVDNDPTRICVGDDDDIINDDDNIIDDCLLPAGVCNVPTISPTHEPTGVPSEPTPEPTPRPTGAPTSTESPTKRPTVEPTPRPSPSPVDIPTIPPTTKQPAYTMSPSQKPSMSPSQKPSMSPSQKPSMSPSEKLSKYPTENPTENQCFIGERCDKTEDCCTDDDEESKGVTCSCYTKMSWNIDVNDYDYRAKFCCIFKGFDGCTNDNDCCKIKTKCLDGVCVDKNTPTRSPTQILTTIIPTQNVPTYKPITNTPTKDNTYTIGPTEDKCFIGEPCEKTEDCCTGDEELKGITCSCQTKMSWDITKDDYDYDAEFCCILKGNYGCKNDNDCCRLKTKCSNGQCVDKNAPTKHPTEYTPTEDPKPPTSYTNPPTINSKSPTTYTTPSPSRDTVTIGPTENKCFIGEPCEKTEDCCTSDEELLGVTCSCYTKMSWISSKDDYDYNAEFCCILKGNYGCKNDNDCCRLRTKCLYGQCVDKNAPENTKTPTKNPLISYTNAPTINSKSPTAYTDAPTLHPIPSPTTALSDSPTIHLYPTRPTYTTDKPTGAPTPKPTADPTEFPTRIPTGIPTKYPTTKNPTPYPTDFPTDQPTISPIYKPTENPIKRPTKNPKQTPTEWPTEMPTNTPTYTPTTKTYTPTQNDNQCFLGKVCQQTEDCCGGNIDARALGITCDGWTKWNVQLGTNDRYCCILRNQNGCTKDEDCCREKTVCWWGKCVHQSEV